LPRTRERQSPRRERELIEAPSEAELAVLRLLATDLTICDRRVAMRDVLAYPTGWRRIVRRRSGFARRGSPR
jgi:hypothetical protein